MSRIRFEQNLKHYDDLGSEKTYNHYPTGWTNAGNTPFKRWKRNVHNGGIADPCIVSWPKGIAARGEIRHQYTHAIDVMLTVLEVLGIEPPAMFRGVPQEEIAGASFKATFDEPQAPEIRTLQYYECYGSRAIYLRWLESRHLPSHPRHPGRRRRRSLRAVYAG